MKWLGVYGVKCGEMVPRLELWGKEIGGRGSK